MADLAGNSTARSGAVDSAQLEVRLQRIVSTKASSPFGVSGAVLAAANRHGNSQIVALGVDARGTPMGADSLFPLASASKLASGLMILCLIEAGALLLDAGIGDYLPEARAAAGDRITVRRLLSHTSGLPLEVAHDLSSPAGSVRYEAGLHWPGPLAEACLKAEPIHAPGEQVRYSNIGYGLLALAAERQTGQSFARLLDELVFAPLSIEAYVDRLPPRPPAAVHEVQSPYAGTSIEPVNSRVWHLLGTPWAGVMTNASGLLALVRAYADESLLISPDMARMARADQTGGAGGGFPTTEPFLGHLPSRSIVWNSSPWGLAVELQGGKEPHWAPSTLPNSFGQIGSSGCLAWYDPDSGVAWAVLGTRTTESGWLLRHGAKIAQSAIAAARGSAADAPG